MTDPSEFEFPVPPHMAEMQAMAQQRFKRPDWETAPFNWLPGVVAIEHVAGRSDDAIVTIAAVRAFPTGFSFQLVGIAREPDPMLDHQMFGPPMHGMSGEPGLPDGLLRVALTFADGETVSSLGMWAPPAPPMGAGSDAAPATRTLMQHGGGGGGGEYRWDYWAWPLPPEGAIRVICEWPALGIEREVTELDAAPIIEAAQRAERLWDDPPEPPSGMWGTGGIGVNVG